MSRRAPWLIGGLVVLVLGACVAWWFMTYEQVEAQIDLPLRGEARYNPLYALQRTLQKMDVDAQSRARLSLPAMKLQAGDVLVLASDVRTLTGTQVDRLLDWITGGGHLLFMLPPSDKGRPGELLEALGLTVHEHHSCLEWRADGVATAGRYCTGRRFAVEGDAEFDWLWGNDEDGYVIGRRAIGAGTVFVASDFDFLTARALDDDANAALAWQVLAPAIGQGRVHLVYAADVPPAYVLIVRYGWPIVVPLLLALLLGLWARSQRFGPLVPPAPKHRRALLEHVQAAGEFAVHRGRGAALYEAVRRRYIERLRRRDPQLAALEGDALVDALARETGLPAAELRQALMPRSLREPEAFTATIKTLMKPRALP